MKPLQKSIVAASALLAFSIPAVSFANGRFIYSDPSPIHVNQYVTIYFTGDSQDLGEQVNYLDIYADGHFICTTTWSNNTPIWSCPTSFSQSGTYTVTATAHLQPGFTDPYYFSSPSHITVEP